MEDYTIDKILKNSQAIALAKIWTTPSSPYIFRSNDNFVCIQQWEGDSDEGDDILVYNWYKWNYATCTIDYIGEEMPLM
jgi:hypothetical protein